MIEARNFTDGMGGSYTKLVGHEDDEPPRYRAGTVLTCERGHPQYRLGRDVYTNQRIEVPDFVPFAFQRRPYHMMQFRDCMCGAPWFLVNANHPRSGIAALHCEGEGWKPATPA